MNIREALEDFNNCFGTVIITAIYDKIKLLSKRFSLQKDDSSKKIIILDSPPLFDRGYSEKSIRKQRPFPQEQLDRFVNKMKEEMPEEDLKNMYNNLHNLKIQESNIKLILLTLLFRLTGAKGVVGGYFSPKITRSIIVAYTPNGEKTVHKLFKSQSAITLEGEYSHELLHLSSMIKRGLKSCIGFNHRYTAPYANVSIGMGINEGYTDLLNERFFGVVNDKGIYECFKIISGVVEDVIGKDKMMKLYFSANLNGLIYELAKYSSHEEAKAFIVNCDLFFKKPFLIKKIIDYLYGILKNKLEIEKDENAKEKLEMFKEKMTHLVDIVNDMMIEQKKMKDIKKVGDLSGYVEGEEYANSKGM
jgi:hypothetical protein